MKIKKGDTVKVISGNEKGKTSEVLAIHRSQNKITVKGVHIVKRHMKAGKKLRAGIVDKTLPIAISNVQVVCPNCSSPTRIGYLIDDKTKARQCLKCKKTMK